MGDHAVVHFEIAGPDGDALQDFYGRLFGWAIESDNPMNYALVHRMPDGIGGGLPQSSDGSSFVGFYVTCGDDVAATLKQANDAGAKTVLDVMDVPEGPTIAMFSDPDGNLVGLVNGSPDDEAPVEGKGAPVVWFEVGCRDAAAGQRFYGDLFGWQIDADNPIGYGEVAPIGHGIGGGVGPSGDMPPYATVYVQTPDLAKTLATVSELGGKTVSEPMDVPGGPTVAHFVDPAGNFVGLVLENSGSA